MIDLDEIERLARECWAVPLEARCFPGWNWEIGCMATESKPPGETRWWSVARDLTERDAKYYAALNPAAALELVERVRNAEREIAITREEIQQIKQDNGQFGVGA